MKVAIKKQSIVKPENDVYEDKNHRLNEDAIFCKNNILGISDGAGGVGIFASEWANYLLQKSPVKPIKSIIELNFWLNEIWEDFYLNYRLKVVSDTFLLNKFENEGSYATLALIWIDDLNNKVDFFSIGDSIIFKYNFVSKKLIIQNQFINFSNFNDSPELINWKEEVDEKVEYYSGTFQIEEEDQFFLASDSLAQLIYAYHLTETKKGLELIENEIFAKSKFSSILENIKTQPFGSFENFLFVLEKSLKSENEFQNMMFYFWRNKYLLKDDYSLIFCNITN